MSLHLGEEKKETSYTDNGNAATVHGFTKSQIQLSDQRYYY